MRTNPTDNYLVFPTKMEEQCVIDTISATNTLVMCVRTTLPTMGSPVRVSTPRQKNNKIMIFDLVIIAGPAGFN